MIGLLLTFMILIVCTTLASVVAVRAWDYFPSRLFVLVTIFLIVMNILTTIRPLVLHPQTGYVLASLSIITLAFLSIVILLLFSQLFMSQWWQGAQPVRWIVLPYVLITGIMLLDMIGGFGWFFDGVRWVGGVYRLQSTGNGGVVVLLVLFTMSWLVHVGLLIAAFARYPQFRLSIGLLIAAILTASGGNLLIQNAEQARNFTNVIFTLPFLAALTYAVLRTRLLLPTRAALNLAVESMDEAIMVLDRNDQIVYVNRAAIKLGIVPKKRLTDALLAAAVKPEEVQLLAATGSEDAASTPRRLLLADRHVVFSRKPVLDNEGAVVGSLLLGRDITELEYSNDQLVAERERLAASVEKLREEKAGRKRLAARLRALSLPAIPVLQGVLIMPLVGEFDAERMAKFVPMLLTHIEREQAQVVLVDVTGLPLIDQEGAAALFDGIQAAHLLGARCVLVGVRPELAEALVALGVGLDRLFTAATLQQAVQAEIRHGRAALRR